MGEEAASRIAALPAPDRSMVGADGIGAGAGVIGAPAYAPIPLRDSKAVRAKAGFLIPVAAV
jgi:hypothetical protein